MEHESAFFAATERVLAAIGSALDAAGHDELDWSENDGVLTIECADERIVVNRHLPNRELWVAAPSGGFHFRVREGRWRDTRSGEELGTVLRRLLQEQGISAIDFPPLAG